MNEKDMKRTKCRRAQSKCKKQSKMSMMYVENQMKTNIELVLFFN
jgi:hypothetical protein